MLVLGISGLARQATAALVHDGEIVAACEEAKLIGRRSPRGVPHKAIEFCLKKAGASAGDVETVAVDLQPARLLGREPAFRGKSVPVTSLAAPFAPSASRSLARSDVRDLLTLPESFPSARFAGVEHHYAHAA